MVLENVSTVLKDRSLIYPPWETEGETVADICELLEELNSEGPKLWRPAQREAIRRVVMKLVREAWNPGVNPDSVTDLIGYLTLYEGVL